jgi:hypothetical protein
MGSSQIKQREFKSTVHPENFSDSTFGIDDTVKTANHNSTLPEQNDFNPFIYNKNIKFGILKKKNINSRVLNQTGQKVKMRMGITVSLKVIPWNLKPQTSHRQSTIIIQL